MPNTALPEHALGSKPKGKKKRVRNVYEGPSGATAAAEGNTQASSDSMDKMLESGSSPMVPSADPEAQAPPFATSED